MNVKILSWTVPRAHPFSAAVEPSFRSPSTFHMFSQFSWVKPQPRHALATLPQSASLRHGLKR